jgi:1,4-dihydroxy-6-naphthoate synthase
MPATETIDLTIAHSPDPDDAFMWRALGDVESGCEPLIDTGPFRFSAQTDDIESLNRRAIERGDLDITAISFHTYAHIAERYALTSCGASMGVGYGPKVVAREEHPVEWLRTPGLRIASPGARTTAHLTMRLLLEQEFDAREVEFDRVIDVVANGEADVGIVIHEGQLTFPDDGLRLIVDLGTWWMEETGLPLPLGGNAVRRDIDDRFGAGTLARLAAVLRGSIDHALAHRDEGLAHAGQFGRGISDERNDEFVRLYVNDLTLDSGEVGERAVQELLSRAARAGLSPDPGVVKMVRPG